MGQTITSFGGWRLWKLLFAFQVITLSAWAGGAPVAPSSLVGSALSSSQVQLTWKDNSKNELGFVIQRSLDSVNFKSLVSVAANTALYKDSNLAAKTKYYYRIGAFNKNRLSNYRYSYSNIVTVTTLDNVSTTGWVNCASEGGICSFSGTHDVRYGAIGSYITKSALVGSIECSNTAFGGDPANGVVKACDYSSSTSSSPTPTPTPTTTTTTMPPTTTTTLPPPVSVSGAATSVTVVSSSAADALNVPVTFGQVFAVGDLPSGTSVTGQLPDGSSLPLQVNIKARHADGSARHAIISAVIPKLLAGQSLQIQLMKSAPGSEAAGAPSQLVTDGFTARVNVTLNGVVYTASADALLKSLAYKQWLSGPIANEWLVSAPLKDPSGVAHPHLSARFDVRGFVGLRQAKVDVILENNWAYEPAPQNFTYDVQIQVGGQTVYSKAALLHSTHARWKKTFWWGSQPQAFIKHNTPYLINSKALPNYNQLIGISEANLASLQTRFSGTAIDPMGSGIAYAYMPTTGGRPDIGLNPSWAVSYLLSMDPRARAATLGMADLAGSWSAHFRDKNTDQPISLYDYPYMTIVGNPGDTYNPVTQKYESFPVCGGDCSNANTLDVSHQPNFSYIPYMLTGDHYYLEELQFYGMYDTFNSNPGYRQNIKGLVSPEQLRGQGWALRTIADAAYLTPDSDRLKAHFMGIIDSNLDWYNANYTNNASANTLGIIVNGYSVTYSNNTAMSPWMDDFFTQSIGHLMDLGFAKAKPLLLWKSKFQIGRMTAPGFCWILGGNYNLTVRDSETSPFYATLADVYQKTITDPLRSMTCAGAEMATNLSLQVGEMLGYSASTEGYPSNYQPALAYTVDSGAAGAATAWQVFMNRTVKPPYQDSPQFSIVPRK